MVNLAQGGGNPSLPIVGESEIGGKSFPKVVLFRGASRACTPRCAESTVELEVMIFDKCWMNV